ncbi:MAG TPA: ATP cone domain-containing protein [Candidatus Saccharimonadales bacterium]
MAATGVVKRSGDRPTEEFSHEKLHSSVLAACLSIRIPEGEAETVANIVSNLVGAWVEGKHAVTSHDLRRIAAKHLSDLQPEASYLYQHHGLVL